MSHACELIDVKGKYLTKVDRRMVPVVNWLNSFSSVETMYCCQGANRIYHHSGVSAVNEAYVLFTCSSLKILKKIHLTLQKSNTQYYIHSSFYNGKNRFSIHFMQEGVSPQNLSIYKAKKNLDTFVSFIRKESEYV